MNKPIRYRKFIQENFLIDKANTGQLVPFIFNEVQNQYYDDLVRDYDIENKGINIPIRENILKARREGFSSLILALFAADDMKQKNPTETDVLSYKDDATPVFRKRYRTYILTACLKKAGYTTEQIQSNINLLEEIAPQVFSIDGDDLELRWNKAHLQCNTASARVGGRGGVRHKILFSEVAFYPDTEKMLAAEMIEATMRQVAIEGGWIFCESTENGIGTYQHRMWVDSQKGKSRFKNRFYGAGEFYTEEQIAVIKSEYVDMDSFRRDYPMSEEDLFKAAAKQFVLEEDLEKLVNNKHSEKELVYLFEIQGENGMNVADILRSELTRLEREHQGYSLYAGIDEAKITDATTMFVMKDRKRSLKGGVAGIGIDTTRGDWLADWFDNNARWFVKRVKFSRSSKSLMYSNLQIVIKDKLTAIQQCKIDKDWVSNEHKHFWNQMLYLEKEIIGNLLVVHHPNGGCNKSSHDYDECIYHDDYPDSWIMAEDVYFEINGVPKRKETPKVPTVPNAVQSLLDKSRFGLRGGNVDTSFE